MLAETSLRAPNNPSIESLLLYKVTGRASVDSDSNGFLTSAVPPGAGAGAVGGAYNLELGCTVYL